MLEVLFYFLLFLLLAPFGYCVIIFSVALVIAYWEYIGEKFMELLRKAVN